MTPQNNGSPSPFRRPGFVLSAAFVMAVVVLGAILLVVNGTGGSSTEAGSPSPQAQASSTTAAADGCHPTDTGRQIPTAAPADVTWSLYQTVALPTSASAGPFVVDGDVARCYAHTPVGALVAGAQIFIRAGTAPGWRKVLAHQLSGTEAVRNAYLKQCETHCGQKTDPDSLGQYAGFRFITYTQATAVIEYVARLPGGSFNVFPLTLVWDGDWKLQLQRGGTATTNTRGIASVEGYVRWGGA